MSHMTSPADLAEQAVSPLQQRVKELQTAVAPLGTLPPAVASLSDSLDAKTPMDSFEALEREVEELKKSASGLPDDVVKELSGINDMRSELGSHARSLAVLLLPGRMITSRSFRRSFPGG